PPPPALHGDAQGGHPERLAHEERELSDGDLHERPERERDRPDAGAAAEGADGQAVEAQRGDGDARHLGDLHAEDAGDGREDDAVVERPVAAVPLRVPQRQAVAVEQGDAVQRRGQVGPTPARQPRHDRQRGGDDGRERRFEGPSALAAAEGEFSHRGLRHRRPAQPSVAPASTARSAISLTGAVEHPTILRPGPSPSGRSMAAARPGGPTIVTWPNASTSGSCCRAAISLWVTPWPPKWLISPM